MEAIKSRLDEFYNQRVKKDNSLKQRLKNALSKKAANEEYYHLCQWIEFPNYPWVKFHKIAWLWHYVDDQTAKDILEKYREKNKWRDLTISRSFWLSLVELKKIKEAWLSRLKQQYPNILPGRWDAKKEVYNLKKSAEKKWEDWRKSLNEKYSENIIKQQWLSFPRYPDCKLYKIWWLFHYVDEETALEIMELEKNKTPNFHTWELSSSNVQHLETIKKRWLDRLRKRYPELNPEYLNNDYVLAFLQNQLEKTNKILNKIDLDSDFEWLKSQLIDIVSRSFPKTTQKQNMKFSLWTDKKNNTHYVQVGSVVYFIDKPTAILIQWYIKEKQKRFNVCWLSPIEVGILREVVQKILKTKKFSKKSS